MRKRCPAFIDNIVLKIIVCNFALILSMLGPFLLTWIISNPNMNE